MAPEAQQRNDHLEKRAAMYGANGEVPQAVRERLMHEKGAWAWLHDGGAGAPRFATGRDECR